MICTEIRAGALKLEADFWSAMNLRTKAPSAGVSPRIAQSERTPIRPEQDACDPARVSAYWRRRRCGALGLIASG